MSEYFKKREGPRNLREKPTRYPAEAGTYNLYVNSDLVLEDIKGPVRRHVHKDGEPTDKIESLEWSVFKALREATDERRWLLKNSHVKEHRAWFLYEIFIPMGDDDGAVAEVYLNF